MVLKEENNINTTNGSSVKIEKTENVYNAENTAE